MRKKAGLLAIAFLSSSLACSASPSTNDADPQDINSDECHAVQPGDACTDENRECFTYQYAQGDFVRCCGGTWLLEGQVNGAPVPNVPDYECPR